MVNEVHVGDIILFDSGMDVSSNWGGLEILGRSFTGCKTIRVAVPHNFRDCVLYESLKYDKETRKNSGAYYLLTPEMFDQEKIRFDIGNDVVHAIGISWGDMPAWQRRTLHHVDKAGVNGVRRTVFAPD